MDASRQPRNHVIDAARAFSIFVVVVFHSLLYQVQAVDGRLAIIPWAPPHWPWWPLSWVFMVIPVFFVAGGFAHAQIVDRMRREGTSYGHYLANRGRRLVAPLLFFVTVVSAVSTVAAWTGRLEEAMSLTRQLMQLLWFIAVYLVIVAVAPAAIAAHDRWGVRVFVVPLLLAAAVDAWSFAVGSHEVRNLNMLLVWPAVHQLGIGYQRGWFRRSPRGALAALASGAAAIVVLVLGFGYPGSSVGFADIPYANVQPPTIAMVALALTQCGVLGLVEASGVLGTVTGGVRRALATINALMMTTYLWHIGGIALAAGLLVAVSGLAPAASAFLLAQPTVATLTVLIVMALVPWIGRLEYRLIPQLGANQDTRRAMVAFGVLIVGTVLVWQSGTVVHPAAPGSTAGVLLVWMGAWVMRGAADRSRV